VTELKLPEKSSDAGKKDNYNIKVSEYKGDKRLKFDEILSAIGDYFDLFK